MKKRLLKYALFSDDKSANTYTGKSANTVLKMTYTGRATKQEGRDVDTGVLHTLIRMCFEKYKS